ncbi:MAG: sulfatase-like hydrolase/transferase [Nannocystaceae bacterium]|nr:hypothetical protein [bacterium]
MLKTLTEHPQARAVGPWLALLLLNAIFVAPAVALDVPEHPSRLLMLSGELFVLVGVGVWAQGWRPGPLRRTIRFGLVFAGTLLWLYHWDELLTRAIIKQAPPLYDQAFLLRHFGVLIFDLWNWKVGLGVMGGLLALVAVVKLARALCRASVAGIHALSRRRRAIAGGVVLAVLVAGTAYERSKVQPNQPASKATLVRWSSPPLARNVAASWRMYRALQRGIRDSPYAGYAQSIPLRRKPDVHLLLVESYGRLLIIDPEAGPAWREQVTGLEQRLRAKGWDMVSAFSRAPISGGRSWLAEGTLLTGIYVRFEAIFQHLVADISQTPNLVSYLDSQGYETIVLAPKVRPRPGIELINRYDYDQQIGAIELDYDGPRYGWGIIPDQYSLGHTQENVLSKVEGPLFFNFHMVSSHAPWQVIPQIQDDWRSIETGEAPEGHEEQPRLATPGEEMLSRMRRYQRKQPQYMWMGYADALKIDAYAAAVSYDLELLTRFLEGMERDALVIIMGDHQPPILSREDSSFDVPMHILARDPALLEEFREQGFVDGLALNSGRPTLLAHEGLFSMMARAFARCCSDGAELPPYMPNGAPGIDDRGRRGG